MSQRTKAWSKEETADFIAIYGQYFEKLNEIGPKRPIYEKLGKELSSKGYAQREWSQLQKKVSLMVILY